MKVLSLLYRVSNQETLHVFSPGSIHSTAIRGVRNTGFGKKLSQHRSQRVFLSSNSVFNYVISVLHIRLLCANENFLLTYLMVRRVFSDILCQVAGTVEWYVEY